MGNYTTEQLNKEIQIRQNNLRNQMQETGANALILTTNVNLFYLTGNIYGGYMYFPIEGEPIHFIKRSNGTILKNSITIRKPEQIAEELQKAGRKLPEKLLLETDSIPYNECNRIIAALGNPQIQNGSVLMRTVRSIKTEYEINQLRQAGKIQVEVYKKIPSLYRRGMTDLDLQIEIEHQMRMHGSIGIFRTFGENMEIFMGNLLAGENAEVPSPFDFSLGGKGFNPTLPIGAANIVIKEGQTFMPDMAGNYGAWGTDLSRVYSVGKTSDLAYKAHQASIDIHNMVRDNARPGTICSEIYERSMAIVKQNNLEEYFMGTRQQAKFVGHGVGLEINEPPVFTPRSKEVLQENMVFALEPKFVIPEIGAVGIENTYLVKENEIENLTVMEEGIYEL